MGIRASAACGARFYDMMERTKQEYKSENTLIPQKHY